MGRALINYMNTSDTRCYTYLNEIFSFQFRNIGLHRHSCKRVCNKIVRDLYVCMILVVISSNERGHALNMEKIIFFVSRMRLS